MYLDIYIFHSKMTDVLINVYVIFGLNLQRVTFDAKDSGKILCVITRGLHVFKRQK